MATAVKILTEREAQAEQTSNLVERPLIKLSEGDSAAFAAALNADRPPNDKLQQAVEKFNQRQS